MPRVFSGCSCTGMGAHPPMPEWIDAVLRRETQPRFLFFTGKGGVGKTSLACASAIALADAGRKVLLVSTDPASNLDEVLAVSLSDEPEKIPGVPGLEALNVNPEEAARNYRERIIGPVRGLLPESALRSMEEQLSGACTTEVAVFDTFARLLGQDDATESYDHVVFDTAPTGHTLRLLMLPSAWSGFFETNQSGTSCLGPLAGLQQQRSVYEGAVDALRNHERTAVFIVARPSIATLHEARRTSDELSQIGMTHQQLLLNGVFSTADADDPNALVFARRAEESETRFGAWLSGRPVWRIPIRGRALLGIDALRSLGTETNHPAFAPPLQPGSLPDFLSPALLLEEMIESGHGVVLVMGKGGVGKTTVAAALAAELARRGHRVRLTTTDPAAHLTSTLEGELPGLTIDRIDPVRETEVYVSEVLATRGAGLDEAGRALLLEDLRSPCTEEIAVFRAFARTVAQGKEAFVVIDTAPTGHTLLLLDATQAYHRELGRQTREGISDEVRDLLPRLRDPGFARAFLVTLPEATPVHEAAALESDLRRAGIEPRAWLVNQSWHGLAVRDPILRQRADAERTYLCEIHELSQGQAAIIPWLPQEPVGVTALKQLFPAPHPVPSL